MDEWMDGRTDSVTLKYCLQKLLEFKTNRLKLMHCFYFNFAVRYFYKFTAHDFAKRHMKTPVNLYHMPNQIIKTFYRSM
jgi:hypothetical protein